MKKAIVFDLDGTLLNTLEDLCDSTNFALEKCDFPKRSLGEVRRFVGNGIRKLIERAVPETAEEPAITECYEIFCEHYKGNMENKTAEYEGISDMLDALYQAGYKMAIVTNKADFAAQALCKNLFGKYVHTVVGSVDSRPNKPAPDGVYYALEQIGVLWGFRDFADLQKAGVKMTAKDTKELKNLLLSLKNG